MSNRILTGLLFILCFILVALIVLPYQADHVSESQNSIKSELAVAYSSEEWEPIPISDYSAFIDHPLFNPKRLPYVEKIIDQTVEPIIDSASTAPIITSPPPDLIGVLTVDNIEMAFVTSNGSMEPISLKVGDNYENWTLKTIHSTQIVMIYNGVEKIITMDWQKKEMLDDFTGSPNETDIDNMTDGLGVFPDLGETELNALKDRLVRQLQSNE